VRSGYDDTVLHRLGNINRILFSNKAAKPYTIKCIAFCDERILYYQFDLGVNMKIVMTTKEYEETRDNVLVDPCAFINCSTLKCDHCPLREAAQKVREAQDSFMKVINSIYQGE